MSTYADMMTPMVDTAVTLIESVRNVVVKAIRTVRDNVPDRLPEPAAALASRIDLADVVNVTFDAAERLLHAQRDAYLDVANAARVAKPRPASPAVKAACPHSPGTEAVTAPQTCICGLRRRRHCVV